MIVTKIFSANEDLSDIIPWVLKGFEHKHALPLAHIDNIKKCCCCSLDSISEWHQHIPETNEETATATEKQGLAFERRWIIPPRGWIRKDFPQSARAWGSWRNEETLEKPGFLGTCQSHIHAHFSF